MPDVSVHFHCSKKINIMNESSADDAGQGCPQLLQHFTQVYPVKKMESGRILRR